MFDNKDNIFGGRKIFEYYDDVEKLVLIDFDKKMEVVDLDEIFIEDVVNILAIGTGKTHNCGRFISEIVNKDKNDNEFLIVSTMSNPLIEGIIKEVCKSLKMYFDFKDVEKLDDIEKFKKNNTYNQLKSLGIIIMNSSHPLKLDDLKHAKCIITNHSYFFPHGHSNDYNNNCYRIQEFLMENGKKLSCVFDEFDQFHKMGIETIDLNYFIGNNFVDSTKKQYYMSDHAFRYCHKANIEKSHKRANKDDFENDFYYKLPEIGYKKKLERDKKSIKYFTSWLEGSYDFERLVLKNIIQIGETKTVECSEKKGKKVSKNIYFKRYNEIKRYKVDTDALMDDDASAKFLRINESIIIIEQKIKILDEDENILIDCNDREDVINFAKKNLTKIEWINYYNTIGAEGLKLYIKTMILRKKQWEFNSKNYYVTATPGKLEKIGYTVNRDNAFKTPCKIEKIDLFIIPNKANCKTDMEIFFKQLNETENHGIETMAIANKLDVIEAFAKDNKSNKEFSNVNPVIDDKAIDTGREPRQAKRCFKNTTYVHQKGNQTQGTNYDLHKFLLQDCHIKIDIGERIIPLKENDDIYIIDYMDESKKNIQQSALRILRTPSENTDDLYKYKAIALFVDVESEEMNLVYHLNDYLKDYGIDTNMIDVGNYTRYEDRYNMTKSILKHVNDRNKLYNLQQEVEDFYTFNNEKLLKHAIDKRVKFNPDDVVKFFEACNDKIMTMSKFGIPRSQLNRILKKYECK